MNKHKIMEVLLSGNNDLTQEEINWAIKNIPNEDEETKYINYDHNHKNLVEAAMVCTERESVEYKKLRSQFFKNPAEDITKSKLVEFIELNASPILIRMLLIEGICNIEDKKASSALDELEKEINLLHDLIKNLKK